MISFHLQYFGYINRSFLAYKNGSENNCLIEKKMKIEKNHLKSRTSQIEFWSFCAGSCSNDNHNMPTGAWILFFFNAKNAM